MAQLRLKAALFDLDGTLTDSDHLHFEAWRDELALHGIPLDHDGYKARISGRPNSMIVDDFLVHLPTYEERMKSAMRKEDRFRELAACKCDI